MGRLVFLVKYELSNIMAEPEFVDGLTSEFELEDGLLCIEKSEFDEYVQRLEKEHPGYGALHNENIQAVRKHIEESDCGSITLEVC